MSIDSANFLPIVPDMDPPLIDLKIPPREECMHTKYYCEENVWKLCEYVQKNQFQKLHQCYAIFISNENKTIPLWCQKSGNAESLCIWDYHVIFVYHSADASRTVVYDDYHVIFVYHSADASRTVVYDVDCSLPFPVHIRTYIELAIRQEFQFQPCYKRLFRVIPAPEYLLKFASDRSMMKNEDGSWIKAPPPYPCITTTESTNNIKDFISMEKNIQIGKWQNFHKELEYHVCPTQGTFMEGAKIGCQDILAIIFAFVLRMGIVFSHRQINQWRSKRNLKSMSRETIVDYFCYLREIAEVVASHNSKKLGGFGKSIEIDDTFLSTRKYHRGRKTMPMTITVLGIYCREDEEGVFFLVNGK
ncbi:hypothetical protein JTE90_025146 [Oedothorax gibbosus]|uniref:Protein N-terminal glutamine amidohydrolase n=1 Tax=Oedothorax gibbosus TaxID=931172 RepID=A0AAV6UHH2_9ARAC|nr:hypothetical protein JTE90_025146 [Oedothorax gibbosus]